MAPASIRAFAAPDRIAPPGPESPEIRRQRDHRPIAASHQDRICQTHDATANRDVIVLDTIEQAWALSALEIKAPEHVQMRMVRRLVVGKPHVAMWTKQLWGQGQSRIASDIMGNLINKQRGRGLKFSVITVLMSGEPRADAVCSKFAEKGTGIGNDAGKRIHDMILTGCSRRSTGIGRCAVIAGPAATIFLDRTAICSCNVLLFLLETQSEVTMC